MLQDDMHNIQQIFNNKMNENETVNIPVLTCFVPYEYTACREHEHY